MQFLRLGLFFTVVLSLTACLAPSFYSAIGVKYLLDGSDYDISVNVANGATSVTCFQGSLSLTNTSGDTWEGTALYSTHLDAAPSENTVRCTASNGSGSQTTDLGIIYMVENNPPDIVMLPDQDFCGNGPDSPKTWNEPLVDTDASSYLTGAEFTLTNGSLSSGLSIDSSNGNLIGSTTTTGDFFQDPDLRMTATTVAGPPGESADFTFNIYEADPCPP